MTNSIYWDKKLSSIKHFDRFPYTVHMNFLVLDSCSLDVMSRLQLNCSITQVQQSSVQYFAIDEEAEFIKI